MHGFDFPFAKMKNVVILQMRRVSIGFVMHILREKGQIFYTDIHYTLSLPCSL